MLFYVLIDRRGRVVFSPAPEVDKHYLRPIKRLNAGIPLEALNRYLEGAEQVIGDNNLCMSDIALEKYIMDRILKGLRRDGSSLLERTQVQLAWIYEGESGESGISMDEKVFVRFKELAEGRQIAEGEFSHIGRSLNIDIDYVKRLMQKAMVENIGEFVPAVKRQGSSWQCVRCGGKNYEFWPSLYGETATCQDCKSIGALNSMQVLFRMKGKPRDITDYPNDSIGHSELSCNGRLFCNDQVSGNDKLCVNDELLSEDCSFEYTFAQRNAALALQEYSSKSGNEDILIWAACGAGKTEICFPLIKRYLEEGKKVLFAAPRQDVVHDVYPRLQRNFRQYRIKALSGALPPDFQNASLTVATTHQVLRFYKAFDLIILDEMDAYPYKDNKVLEFGIKHALREGGRLVYLTATPSKEIIEETDRGECVIIRLPARYHGYPLPVPEIVTSKFLIAGRGQKDKLSPYFQQELTVILKRLVSEGPLLIFVPTISLVQAWVNSLQVIFKDKVVEGSWSTDPDRRKKVSDLVTSRTDIFVSTSILERGITINKVQTVILYADHELYDVRTLVQMAGRTGRTLACPSGRVLFIASKTTKEMILAIEWIEEQNILARKEGFLSG